MRFWTMDDVVRDAGEPADPARKVEGPRVSARRRRRDWRGHTRSCRSSSSCGAGAPPSSSRWMTSTSSLSKTCSTPPTRITSISSWHSSSVGSWAPWSSSSGDVVHETGC